MGRKAIDLTGRKLGKLTVLSKDNNYIAPCGKIITQWKCKCDCGNEVVVTRNNLINGNSKSCGCSRRDNPSALKHGKSRERLYNTWQHIISRCCYKQNKQYNDYGGRGITVCAEWIGERGLENFINWAMQNGYAENLTIDRIDNNKGYSPDNCRWADKKTQNNNKRSNHLITYNGETHTMAEWAVIKNINYNTLKHRINTYHWNIEKALTTP